MKIVLTSLSYFNHLRTFLLHFIIIPMFQAFLMVLIMQDYNYQLSSKIMTVSIVLSSGTMAVYMVSKLFIGNMNRGIDKYVIVHHPFSFYYWGNQFLICFFGAYLLAVINGVLFASLNIVSLYYILILAPFCIVSGIVLGLFASCLSWTYHNPYFWTNIVASMIVLLGGSVGAVSTYPPLWQLCSNVLPFSTITNMIYTNQLDVISIVINLSIWIILTLCLYIYQCNRRIARQRYSIF
ncbi:hypothetical protein GMA11_00130 [Granulicatella sp. zg-ZJ]|uniref:hypothetical protein n=1 Tax=Granulicatella sp. zg-ZJ TaxID=2678504 RepID=UPI0013D5E4EF|nr:hypothetical protein [Granulicatella sp. zg-ZJ]MBS4749658.1 hypothetical protein [Carnobacteriaceae bacterium zg-ZUI78]NEW61787.1 hypothetical protein [Granulicatella sp. zg-ZJ]